MNVYGVTWSAIREIRLVVSDDASYRGTIDYGYIIKQNRMKCGYLIDSSR